MADGYLIGAEYLFKSNAQRELGLIAKYSAQAAEGIEALQKSTSALSASLETMIRFVGGARSSLDAMLPTIDRLAVAFGRLDTMVESIGPTAAASGAEADTAFTGVVARLEAVTVAARTAAGSLRMVGRAGVTGAAGSTVQGGVGAGFASGAAMRFAGNAAGVGGLAALATLAIGTKQRANLQDSMIQTGLAMGRSDQWVQANLLPTAMRMSMNTAQSVGDSMGLIRTMATSGINDPRDIQALSMPMARYADTQYLGKNHVPFDQSIASIAGVAHQLNLRTAGQLVPFLNTAYKISNDMPDSMKKAFTQIGYFGPGYAGSGVSPQEILKLQANADRLGYGSGKSGTGLTCCIGISSIRLRPSTVRNAASGCSMQRVAREHSTRKGTSIRRASSVRSMPRSTANSLSDETGRWHSALISARLFPRIPDGSWAHLVPIAGSPKCET